MGNRFTVPRSLHKLRKASRRIKLAAALEEEREGLLQSTVLRSDDDDWDKPLREAIALKATRKQEKQKDIRRIRMKFDRQGTFSANLVSYLTLCEEMKAPTCQKVQSESVATFGSSVNEDWAKENKD